MRSCGLEDQCPLANLAVGAVRGKKGIELACPIAV
ncbi:hypothetical protein B0G69_8280 [Paraburkholderia sp. RAU2J]|nr:hypothetical protein B0G69_8280 [Paraburkholderia sp. RAU2J]